MDKFVKRTARAPPPPKVPLLATAGAYVNDVARLDWERKNLTRRWPRYSPHAALHHAYRNREDAYGWAGCHFRTNKCTWVCKLARLCSKCVGCGAGVWQCLGRSDTQARELGELAFPWRLCASGARLRRGRGAACPCDSRQMGAPKMWASWEANEHNRRTYTAPGVHQAM